MSEGELKKRLKLMTGYSEPFEQLMDEAKKEFPMITDEKYRIYAQPRQYFELEQDRRSWFKKWFGEP